MDVERKHSDAQTVLGIVVGVLMVIPGLVAGGIATAIYRVILSGYISGSLLPEFLQAITLQWFPGLVRGLVAGGVAQSLTMRIIKDAEPKIVAFATAAAWIAIAVIVIAASEFPDGLLSGIAQTLGLAIGLGAVAKEQKRPV